MADVPADEATASGARIGEPSPEHLQRKRLRQHQQTDQQLQLLQEQGQQRDQQHGSLHREEGAQTGKQGTSTQRELFCPHEHSQGGAPAKCCVCAESVAARAAEESASASAHGTAAPAVAVTAQQSEAQELRQVQQPEGGHSIQQDQLFLIQKEGDERPDLHFVEEATQQLCVHSPAGGLVSRSSSSPQVQAWQYCNCGHSALVQDGQSMLQQHTSLENSQQQLDRQQSETRGYAELRQQQVSPGLHVSSALEGQSQQQLAQRAEPSVDPAQEQIRQAYQQRHGQRHSSVRQEWRPQFDIKQYDDEILENILAAVAAAEDNAEAPANGHSVGYAEHSTDACQGDSRLRQSQLPRGEPARQNRQEEDLDRRGQCVRQRRLRDQLQQEGQLQHSDRQEQNKQEEELPGSQNVNSRLLHVRGNMHQTCDEQRASQREQRKSVFEARRAGNEHICQNQRSAETEQWGSQQQFEQQLNETEGQGLEEQQKHQGRAMLHSPLHERANQLETSSSGAPRLQREQIEITDQHGQEDDNLDSTHQEQPEIRQAAHLRKRPSRECDVSSTLVTARRSRGRETELELDEEVCDFLEADLPPAAVTRWSDYLLLREHQHQQRQRLEPQEWQPPQQQTHRQAQQWQYVRQHRRAVPGERSFCQTDAAISKTDLRTSASLNSDERLRSEAVESPTNCVPCYAEILTDPQGTPRRAADGGDRGACSSPYLTSRTPCFDTSPRSALATNLAPATAANRNVSRPTSGGANNRPRKVAEDSTNSRTGERSSSTGRSTEVSSNAAPRNRQADDRHGACSSNSARTIIEGPSGSCDISRTAAGPVLSPLNYLRGAQEDVYALDGQRRPGPTLHPTWSSDAQTGAPPATPCAAPASAPCEVPFPSAGVHSRNYVNVPTSPAPSACVSLRSSPVLTAPSVSSVRSPRTHDIASACPAGPASHPAAHGHSHTLQSLPSETAATACMDELSSLACSSAPAPRAQRMLTASATRRAAEYTAGSAARRPVSLEDFIQVRSNRLGSRSSRRLLASSTANRAAADLVRSASEAGVSDTQILSHSALRDSTRASEGLGGVSLAGSSIAANSEIIAILPSTLSPSSGMHRAAASDTFSGSRRRSAAEGVERAPASQSLLHGSTLASGWQGRTLHALSGEHTNLTDERTTATIPTSANCGVPGLESDGADRSPQMRTDVPAVIHVEHVNASIPQAARRPSTETKEGAKRRRDSATTVSARGNVRRYIYLNSHEECTVCFVEIRVKGEVAMVEDCRHCFCCACLARWIKKSRTCPLCRRPVTTVELWRHAHAALIKNSLAYGFLRRLRPDKNNVLKPVTLPRRRPGGQRGSGNNLTKAVAGGSAEVQI